MAHEFNPVSLSEQIQQLLAGIGTAPSAGTVGFPDTSGATPAVGQAGVGDLIGPLLSGVGDLQGQALNSVGGIQQSDANQRRQAAGGSLIAEAQEGGFFSEPDVSRAIRLGLLDPSQAGEVGADGRPFNPVDFALGGGTALQPGGGNIPVTPSVAPDPVAAAPALPSQGQQDFLGGLPGITPPGVAPPTSGVNDFGFDFPPLAGETGGGPEFGTPSPDGIPIGANPGGPGGLPGFGAPDVSAIPPTANPGRPQPGESFATPGQDSVLAGADLGSLLPPSPQLPQPFGGPGGGTQTGTLDGLPVVSPEVLAPAPQEQFPNIGALLPQGPSPEALFSVQNRLGRLPLEGPALPPGFDLEGIGQPQAPQAPQAGPAPAAPTPQPNFAPQGGIPNALFQANLGLSKGIDSASNSLLGFNPGSQGLVEGLGALIAQMQAGR